MFTDTMSSEELGERVGFVLIWHRRHAATGRGCHAELGRVPNHVSFRFVRDADQRVLYRVAAGGFNHQRRA